MSSTQTPISPLSSLIFASRWLQLPLYLGLILAQCVYVFLFGKELWHLLHKANTMGEQEIMLLVLGLIDVVMISNLLVMVIVGGYETFVSRLRLENHPDQPEWLSHVNASVLKVKTFIAAGNLDGLPSCNSDAYLQAVSAAVAAAGPTAAVAFKCSAMTSTGVMWQTIIHAAFILSAIGIAYTDKLMNGTPSRRCRTDTCPAAAASVRMPLS